MALRLPRLQELVWFGRALPCVIRTRIGLTLRRSDALRAKIVAQAPTRNPAPWELQLAAMSVTAASRLVPGASCLTQALAAQYLLARRGGVSTVRISLPASDIAELKPHAWLLSGQHVVLGGTAEEFIRHRPLVHYEASSITPVPVAPPAADPSAP